MMECMEKFLPEWMEMGSPSSVRMATAAVVPGSTPTMVYIRSPGGSISFLFYFFGSVIEKIIQVSLTFCEVR